MPSFDITVSVDLQEVDNAINQAQKELGSRYDFKGSKSKIDWDSKKGEITVVGDDDYKLSAVLEMIKGKFAKRNLPVKNLIYGKVDNAFEGTVRQKITVQQGIPQEKAKKLVKIIKDSKVKVQPSIQQEQIRVTGKKRDDLQEIMAVVKNAEIDLEFTFENMRD